MHFFSGASVCSYQSVVTREEKGGACFVIWKHVSKRAFFFLKVRAQTRKHLNDCVNMYDWHYTQWVMCNRKGFGLIINKLITHLVDGSGRGRVEVDWGSCSPCCASIEPAFFWEKPLSIFAAEKTYSPKANSISRPPMRVPQTHTDTHTPANPQGRKCTDTPSKFVPETQEF